MGVRIAIVPGERFGRLVVQGRVDKVGRKRIQCLCDCGNTVMTEMNSLKSGSLSSCGCLRRDLVAAKNHKHGYRRRESNTGEKTRTEYTIWKRMRTRCNDVNDRKYPEYGGRGIKCCDRWNDFTLFFEDMGERPSAGHSLDRFPDVNGNYEPGNVRWATATQQARNKRNNRIVEWEGENITLAEVSERTGVSCSLLRSRVSRGWDIARAVSTSPGPSYVRVKKTEGNENGRIDSTLQDGGAA